MLPSLIISNWLPPVELCGPEQIPVIARQQGAVQITDLVAFDRLKTATARSTAAVHFYVDDKKLERVARDPSPLVAKCHGFGAVISPDFSVYRSSPRHERILSIRLSRAVGAYFQSRGFPVVPTVRWATADDFDFCFLGLPTGATLAVSPHGCCRRRDDRQHFREGLIELVRQARPRRLFVHGPLQESVFHPIMNKVDLVHFSSDIARAHGRG